jgi:hypothetical protein
MGSDGTGSLELGMRLKDGGRKAQGLILSLGIAENNLVMPVFFDRAA